MFVMSAFLVGVQVDRTTHLGPKGPPQAQKTSPNTPKLTKFAFVHAQLSTSQSKMSKFFCFVVKMY